MRSPHEQNPHDGSQENSRVASTNRQAHVKDQTFAPLRWYQTRTRRTQLGLASAILIVVIVLGGLISLVRLPHNTPPAPTPTAITSDVPLLPGQKIWRDGVSSYLFGTDDTQEYTDDNIETNATVQKALRDAGFTLIRSDFEDNASDAVNEKRMKTIENIGAHGICTLHNIFNLAYDKHLVSYLGKRCLMYEIGNELDLGDDIYEKKGDFRPLTSQEYVKQWNILVPELRKINPDAKFIGPVTYNDQGDDCHDDANGTHCFMQDFLAGVKESGVLPDAISFHWYPCYEDGKAACLAKVSTFVDVTSEVRSWTKSILGKSLPIGITEWNADPGSSHAKELGEDAAFMSQFSTEALKAMIRAHLDFACQFDALSNSNYGLLDLFDQSNGNQPKAQFIAIRDLISRYKR